MTVPVRLCPPAPCPPPSCRSCGTSPCSCGLPPSWAMDGMRMRQAWKELEQFRCLIADLIRDLQSQGAIAAVATVGTAPPQCPITGQMWWNKNDGQLYVWNCGAWVAASCCPPAK